MKYVIHKMHVIHEYKYKLIHSRNITPQKYRTHKYSDEFIHRLLKKKIFADRLLWIVCR